MFLARLNVTRKGYFGSGYSSPKPDAPLECTVEIIGQSGKTELNLPQETSDKIVALIAEELAASARADADAMTVDFVLAGSSAKLIEAA